MRRSTPDVADDVVLGLQSKESLDEVGSDLHGVLSQPVIDDGVKHRQGYGAGYRVATVLKPQHRCT